MGGKVRSDAKGIGRFKVPIRHQRGAWEILGPETLRLPDQARISG
jgi:hypothetical protein